MTPPNAPATTNAPRTALEPPSASLLDGASLFLDFDGTLVEIAERPDAVSVDDRLGGLMARLAERLEGRLAIVSGRPIRQIDALFGAPDFAVSGSHGAEIRWADGRCDVRERPAALDRVLAEMRQLAAEHPGVLVEDKPLGAALHYRTAPEAEWRCQALAVRLADEHDLAIQAGKMVFELRAAGDDKGKAILALMEAPPFAGTRPVFVGDDWTDEAGFAAVTGKGGAGVLVGEARETAARYRLDDVAAVLAWLEAMEARA